MERRGIGEVGSGGEENKDVAKGIAQRAKSKEKVGKIRVIRLVICYSSIKCGDRMKMR